MPLQIPIDYLWQSQADYDFTFFQRKVWIGCDDLIHAEIPLAARMFAYIDVWDALVPNRPYRRAMEKSEIWAHFGQEGKPKGCSTQIS